MAIETIYMPQLGEGITEAEITQWLKGVGDTIEAYEPLLEIITDKVTTEVPVTVDGVVQELLFEEGDVVQMGDPIAKIEVEGEASEPVAEAEAIVEEKVAPVAEKPKKTAVKKAGGARLSPAVVRLAGEHNIDLEQVVGTGSGGRITRKDIQKAIDDPSSLVSGTETVSSTPDATTPKAAPEQAVQPASKPAPKTEVPVGAKDIELPISSVRQAIARNMVNSVSEIPHAWTMIEADATPVVEIRNKYKDEFKAREGYSLSYLAFFVKAVAQALREHPILNSSWAGDKIIQYGEINISIAIAANDLLYVPVIKNADEKSVKGIAREINELGQKAQNNRLTAEDMSGGTFTVNSTGSFGSIASMGIINHPQAGILQVESIVKKPVFKDNSIAVRDMVNLCLSIDHRLLDGKAAGEFLQTVREKTEQMDSETFSIY